MQTRIKNTRFEMTSDVKEYLDKKLASLEHFFEANDPTASWDIELEKLDERIDSQKKFRAELTLQTGGKQYRAEAVGETMLAALDEVKDELKSALRGSHSKSRRLIRESGRRLKAFLRGWR